MPKKIVLLKYELLNVLVKWGVDFSAVHHVIERMSITYTSSPVLVYSFM